MTVRDGVPGRPAARLLTRLLAWLPVAALAIVLVSCTPAPSVAPTTAPAALSSPTAVPGPSTPPASPAVGSASPSASQGAASSGSPGGGVALDETLLSILPPSVDGATVSPEPQSFTEATRDAAFVANVQSAVFAVAVAEDDIASGVVARLRPGVWSDAFFRDWRDTYNEGACAQAGGVVGNAEAQLGGRTVYITSCAGGLLVYHVYLPGRDVVVSLFSVGTRRFGEQLMSDLRP